MSVDEWRKSGKYLPRFMRDFHDQKELFKAIDEAIAKNPNDIPPRPDWIQAHIYVVDIFLWWMAARGYTLQKTRKHGEFRDVKADVSAYTKKRIEQFKNILSEPEFPPC